MTIVTDKPESPAIVPGYPFGARAMNVNGSTEADSLWGETASDRIYGADGNDLIFGGIAGDDLLIGGNGDDLVSGGRGDDTLVGGRGDDYFVGGKGADTYLSNAGAGDHDTIEFGHDGDRWQIPRGFTFDQLDSNGDGHLGRLDDMIDWIETGVPGVDAAGLHFDFGKFTVDIIAPHGLYNLSEAETFSF